jgi:N-acetyl sugar amidotransferase
MYSDKFKPIKDIRYCNRCCFPETMEGIKFDSLGICTACISSEDKMHINWLEREVQLKKILEKAKLKSGNNYDCVLPISGGKDSFFQAHILTKKYNIKPLAVTFSHNWYSEVGVYNLQRCLQVFSLDHIQFTPSRTLVNNLAKKSLPTIGDSCWHCHAGVGAFPMQIATNFNIPLLIWGESVSENDPRSTYGCPVFKFDKDYFSKVSSKVNPDNMIDKNISKKDIHSFKLPNDKQIKIKKVYGIHLGDYIFWDDERQTEFIKKEYGWKETDMEGTYKRYKSVECIMSGVHDFACYVKRGFGRTTWQASVDVRNGLLERKDAFNLIKKYDFEKPGALNYFLKITGLSEKEFFSFLKKQKHKSIKNIKLQVRSKKINDEFIPFYEKLINKHLLKSSYKKNKY